MLDKYVAVWTPTINGLVNTKRTYFEIAGEVYFAIAEAKILPGMSAIADQDIVEARQRIEELIEHKCKQAFVPRGRRAVLYGRGSSTLTLGDWFLREIYSAATIDGTVTTAYTATELADLAFGSRQLFRRDGTVFPWGSRNVSVHYAYGMDEPPEPVKRAALLMCQASFVLSDQEGNPTRPLSSVLTDIPEVKELLEPYMLRNGAHSIQVST